MNTKLVLTASALVLGVAGLAGSFAPQELAAAFGLVITPTLALLIQLHAALLFGFAMVNWFARGSLIGGIYNRPVAMGNVAHFVLGALASMKVVLAGNHSPVLIAVAAVYAIFAGAFTAVLMRSPVAATS